MDASDMGTVLRTLLALTAATVQICPPFMTAPAPPLPEPIVAEPALEPGPVRLEFVDMPDELVTSVIWAIDLFEQADLTLPPLRVVCHGDDPSPCGGYRGVHETNEQGSVIGLCTTDAGPVTEALILHELSHAWLEHNLTEARQADFQALRGYEYWRNRDAAAWHENGCEQAAEIMTWGLIDRPAGIVTIHDHGCDALEAGYRALTGAAPLHGLRDYC